MLSEALQERKEESRGSLGRVMIPHVRFKT